MAIRTPSTVRARAWLAVAMLAGCAPSGDDPRNTLSVYEPPGEEYRLRYLAPPWELTATDGTTARLRIESSATSFGGPEAGVPKFELMVTVEAGDPEVRARSDASAFGSAGHRIVAGPRAVEASGASGIEVLAQSTSQERFYRNAYFPLGGGRLVRLAFEATPRLDTPEVDAMIAAIGIGPGSP